MPRRLVRTAVTAAVLLMMLVLAGPAAAQETQDTTLLPEALRSAPSSKQVATPPFSRPTSRARRTKYGVASPSPDHAACRAKSAS